MFLRMRDNCNTKHLWYKYHRLFINCPVVITMKSWFNILKYYVCLNHCNGLRCTAVTWFALVVKTFLKTSLSRVNLRQISLLKGHILRRLGRFYRCLEKRSWMTPRYTQFTLGGLCRLTSGCLSQNDAYGE